MASIECNILSNNNNKMNKTEKEIFFRNIIEKNEVYYGNFRGKLVWDNRDCDYDTDKKCMLCEKNISWDYRDYYSGDAYWGTSAISEYVISIKDKYPVVHPTEWICIKCAERFGWKKDSQ